MEYQDVTLAGIKENRPDLFAALQEDMAQGEAAKQAAAQLKALRAENDRAQGRKPGPRLQEAIEGELKAAKLDPTNKTACSDTFLAQLREAKDEPTRKALIEDRVKLVVSTGTRNVGPITTAPGTGGAVAADPVAFRRSLMGG